MLSLIKYIVFFILCFKIQTCLAAEVIFAPQDDDILEETTTADIPLNLPHPAVMQKVLAENSDSFIGRMLLLGKYFDERYPGNAIKTDFSGDVSEIFPDLNQQEVYSRTNTIRSAVNIYRWGMQKYKDIKAQLIAPKEPPLVVDEQDYDLPGQHEYIDAGDGRFALVYDFKKVLSYGNNPRDIEAMEAWRLKQLEKKKAKTGFEKFQASVSKLELSKIPFYGLTLPNPFVGNAGIGTWQEKNGFRARMIAEKAKLGEEKDFFAAIHFNIPSHRFMLGNNLGNNLIKPAVELIESQNVADYEVLYPLPLQLLNSEMVAAYAGDLAFPIKIKLKEPGKNVKLKAKVSFFSCDNRLDCEKLEFTPDVFIEADIESVPSSVQNFIRQSYYNIPQPENKYIKLERISADVSPDSQEVRQIYLTFKFKNSVKNFSLLLEDKFNTVFSRPQIAINKDTIYATVKPLTNNNRILGETLDITVRLNSYARFRTTALLTAKPQDLRLAKSFATLLLTGLFIGLLCSFMPIAFPFLGLKLADKQNLDNKYYLNAAAIIFILINIFFVYVSYTDLDFVWGIQYRNVFYITFAILSLTLVLLSRGYMPPIARRHMEITGSIAGGLIVLLIPLSYTPGLEQFLGSMWYLGLIQKFAVVNAFAFGMASPFLLVASGIMLAFNKQSFTKIKKVLKIISLLYLCLTIIVLLLLLVMQMNWKITLAICAVLATGWLLFKYFFSFLQALYQTSLKKKYKRTAEKVVVTAFLTIILTLSWVNWKIGYLNDSTDSHADKLQDIPHLLSSGKNVLVGIEADWCWLCKYNNLTVLNSFTLERWKKSYNLEYIAIQDNDFSPSIQQFLESYGHYSPPLYVLYNYHLENGMALPDFLKNTEIEQTLQNFEI